MSRISFVSLLSVLALILLGSQELLSATVTYAVGTCKPGLHSYSTITAALSAVPSPNVVLVCPGTYREQVEITFPVNFEGVAFGSADQAIIYPPPNGFVANATDDYGDLLAVQLFLNNVAGPVNINNLTFDAQGQGAYPARTVGIFYQNSSGTVNQVTTRYQNDSMVGGGEGIYIEGGASNPTVTVENSSVHEYFTIGIHAETNTTTSQLTAIIKGNYVNGGSGVTGGIQIAQGTTSTVSNNYVLNNANYGIPVFGAVGGSISGNVLVNNWIGVFSHADAVSVTSNRIFESFWAIEAASMATIQGNSIVESAVGVEFVCSANPNVHSNTISDTAAGIKDVPGAIASPNSYFNVGTIRTGGC
jgi:hypothetical protein